jgi:hypothetical protein
MRKIAIVGGGPSAVFAIMACKDLGIKPDVFAPGLGNNLGAFWFHWVPPVWEKFTLKVPIKIKFVGDREGYIKKQWEGYDIPNSYVSSFPEEEKEVFGFNPLRLTKDLNESDFFNLNRIDRNLSKDDLLRLGNEYDLVFHSFPTMQAAQENSDLIFSLPILIETSTDPLNYYTEYDGLLLNKVSRRSNLWGWKFTELRPIKHTDPDNWIEKRGMTVSFVKDLVPFDRSVNFFPLHERIVPIGRLARFDRKALSHDAYNLVRGYVENI